MNVHAEIEDFVNEWDAWRLAKHYEKYPSLHREPAHVKLSSKFAKIVVDEAVRGFIALTDGENKKLGPYKKGDIFRPDTWSSPAKHKRGSVFDPKRMDCMSEYGVKALPSPNHGYSANADTMLPIHQ